MCARVRARSACAMSHFDDFFLAAKKFCKEADSGAEEPDDAESGKEEEDANDSIDSGSLLSEEIFAEGMAQHFGGPLPGMEESRQGVWALIEDDLQEEEAESQKEEEEEEEEEGPSKEEEEFFKEEEVFKEEEAVFEEEEEAEKDASCDPYLYMREHPKEEELGEGPSIYCDMDGDADPKEEVLSPITENFSMVSECSNVSCDGDRYKPKWFENKPKPSKAKRRRYVSPQELVDLRDEEVASRLFKVPWQKRGPPEPFHEGYRWRGQRFRPTGGPEGKGRWGNSGGQHRNWYLGYYRAKGKGKAAVKKYLQKFGQSPSMLKKMQAASSSTKGSSKKGK